MMHSPFRAVSGCTTAALVLLCSFASISQADVRFTEPSAGANLTAGQIDVRWEDSGISPPISELTQYTLSLMVGGNDDNDMQPLSTFQSEGTFTEGNSAQGTIPEGIAANVPNGFFFRMTSTRQEGGVLINYSDRFSIAGLSGDTALNIKQAASALDGNTDGPPAVGNSASSSSSTAASTSAPTETSSSLTSDTPASATLEQNVSTNTVTSTASPDDTNNDDEEDVSTGISKGATAAIAVAVTVAVIAICAALARWYLVRRRRKQNEVQEITPGASFADPHTPMNELSAENLLLSPRRAWTHQTELSSDSMVYEAGSGERPPELDHMAFRAELEGDMPSTTPTSPGLDITAFRAELKGSQPSTPVTPLSKI